MQKDSKPIFPVLKSLAALIPPNIAVKMVPMEIRKVRMKTIIDECPVFLMTLPTKVTLQIRPHQQQIADMIASSDMLNINEWSLAWYLWISVADLQQLTCQALISSGKHIKEETHISWCSSVVMLCDASKSPFTWIYLFVLHTGLRKTYIEKCLPDDGRHKCHRGKNRCITSVEVALETQWNRNGAGREQNHENGRWSCDLHHDPF